MMACDTGNTQLVITIAMAKLQSILPKLYQVRKNSSSFYLLNNYSNQFFSSFYKRIVRNLLVSSILQKGLWIIFFFFFFSPFAKQIVKRKQGRSRRFQEKGYSTNSEPRTKSRTLYRLSKAGEEENNGKRCR
jgi:hypothetical protein